MNPVEKFSGVDPSGTGGVTSFSPPEMGDCTAQEDNTITKAKKTTLVQRILNGVLVFNNILSEIIYAKMRKNTVVEMVNIDNRWFYDYF